MFKLVLINKERELPATNGKFKKDLITQFCHQQYVNDEQHFDSFTISKAKLAKV